MTTRQERLDQAAAASKARIATEQRKLSSIASAQREAQREAQRKARDTRRYQLGTLCDQAGLLGCHELLCSPPHRSDSNWLLPL